MEQYLIDTNVVSDYFSASLSVAGMALMDIAIDAIPNISIISQIELLCWNTNQNTMLNVQNFIADASVFDINHSVIAHCVTIRKGRKIKTPDAIIAATALAHNLTLISSDKGFENIPRLKLIDPFTL